VKLGTALAKTLGSKLGFKLGSGLVARPGIVLGNKLGFKLGITLWPLVGEPAESSRSSFTNVGLDLQLYLLLEI